MHIELKIYSHLQRHAPQGRTSFSYDLPQGTSVAALMEHLELNNDQADKIILVNGRPAQGDKTLDAGDLVVVFPVVEGG
ncbi:MAG: MoaD/ThiS family protein [Desulfovermiculus sp.]